MEKRAKASLIAKIKFNIAQAQSDIAELEEQNKPISPENSIGRVSRMDAINNKSIIEATLLTTKEKLQKLERALANSEDPNFGLCTRCGNPIPEGRLMLMPEATQCVQCS